MRSLSTNDFRHKHKNVRFWNIINFSKRRNFRHETKKVFFFKHDHKKINYHCFSIAIWKHHNNILHLVFLSCVLNCFKVNNDIFYVLILFYHRKTNRSAMKYCWNCFCWEFTNTDYTIWPEISTTSAFSWLLPSGPPIGGPYVIVPLPLNVMYPNSMVKYS